MSAMPLPVPHRLLPPRWPGLAAIALVLVGLILLPQALVGQPFELRLFTIIFLYAVLGHGWNILGGFAGQTSIGHGVFFGLGAYTSTLLHLWYGVNPWLGMAAGAAVAAAFGVLIGLPCFRLRGHYFVIATLVVAEIIYQLFAAWPAVGGASGLTIPVAEAGLQPFQFHRDRTPYYYIALAMLAAVTALVWWLSRSRLGYILQAIRDDEEALRSLGLSPARYKLIAMAMSAAIVGAGGVFYAQYVLFIDPSSVLTLALSVVIALIPIFGGVGTVAGPIIGAAVLVPISEYSRVWFSGSGRNVDLLIYGFMIMIIAVYRPNGVISLFERRSLDRFMQRLRIGRARAGTWPAGKGVEDAA
jgi:branched-chain amino acid transport system permease protein